jgi:hypothetical protein
MNAVMVKNNETSWDVIHLIGDPLDENKKSVLDAALAKNLPIVGMETTSYKNSSKTGATWNGTSFSGGPTPPADKIPLDIYDEYKKFSFICDNVVVSNFVVKNDSPISEFISTAFENEVILVNVPSDQSVSVGGTYGWDGSRFSAV